MRGFVDLNGNYYEAEELLGEAVEVQLRPDADHDFDADTQTWKPKTLTLAEVKDREKLQVSTAAGNRLARIDDAVRRLVVLLAEAKPVPPALIVKVKKNDLIEDARDAALIAIDAAATKAAARAVAPAIVWP